MELAQLNKEYRRLDPQGRVDRLFEDFAAGKILVTSSFGSTSAILLHLISKVSPKPIIHFIDTSYNFDETLDYKRELQNLFGLEIKVLKADPKKNQFTRENETWRFNHELCCFVNKIDPVDQIKHHYDVWVSGLLGFQNANRQGLEVFEQGDGLIKFHPVIDLSKENATLYSMLYELPEHPLVARGYSSIGCTHCTKKGVGRSGRWREFAKTECGLHA